VDADRHARQKQLFQDALDRPRHEREAFLQRACGGDTALLAEVRELLAAEDGAAGFLDAPALTGALLAAALPHPAQLGPFRILRLIGEGGMGAVYEAEQDRPHRRVALKVLHPELGTPQMLRRFELESEVLGRLEHPGIARIYEAGTHDTGHGLQPWFAMELVEGLVLTEYCARSALPLEQRIELVARICDAVQHAHQRGIVHRDLKPANILVDAAGQPKVLDFGIARALDGELGRATLRTDPGMLVGTLQYMSPEQATADPDAIDVRTDVYSLGVMLYELAAGRPPHDLARLPMPEALRRVLEVEPAPLRSAAGVPTDVAVIAHKALSKDKDRRYASAREFGSDLRRALRHEPILARPASGLYQLRKFARRHKGLTAGMALAAFALVAATVVSLIQVHVADQAREHAVRSACRAAIAAAMVAAEHDDFAACRRQLETVAPGDRNWEWRHLASRADRTLARLDGSDFLDAMLDASGKELFTVTGTGAVRRWRVPDLQPLANCQLEEAPGGPAAFRRDGTAVAAVVGPTAERVGVFDVATGRRIAQVAVDEPRLSLLAFAPDGARIAFGARAAWLWDPAGSGAPLHLPGREYKALAFSGDGLRVACGYGPPPEGAGYFMICDARTGACIGRSRYDSYLPVADLALDATGARLAVAYADKRARLWDVGAGRLLERFEGHRGAVRRVAIDPRGERLASAGDDETIRLWRLDPRAELGVLGGLGGPPLDLAFSADGSLLLARTNRGIALWSTAAGPEVLSGHPSYVYGVAFTGGARMLSASYDGVLRAWDADSGDVLLQLKLAGGEGIQALTAAAAAPVFACAQNSGVRLWDADACDVLRTFDTSKESRVVDLALCADGSLLALRTDHAVVLWDTRTGAVVRRWQCDSATWYCAVAISPGGERVAADLGRRSIALWSVATGTEIARLAGHSGPVEGLAFSADGTLLASGGEDRIVRLWDARTGAPRWASAGHTDRVYALAFSPDGSRLASGANDSTICLWDVASGEQAALLRGHTDYVFSLAFSPDGSRLISGSGDHTVRVWDAGSMQVRWPVAERSRRLRAQVEPAVRELLARETTPARAAERLRADPTLAPQAREASIQALLRLTSGRPQ